MRIVAYMRIYGVHYLMILIRLVQHARNFVSELKRVSQLPEERWLNALIALSTRLMNIISQLDQKLQAVTRDEEALHLYSSSLQPVPIFSCPILCYTCKICYMQTKLMLMHAYL